MTKHPLLERILSDSRATRRDFMVGASALGLSAAAASTMWQNRAHAATPKKGGNFKVGIEDGNTTDSLDPGTTESVYMIQMNHIFRNYLTEIDENNQVAPDISEGWDASDDAKVWSFKLRKGVTFHNGKEFNSADAVASLNYHRGEASKSAAKSLLTDVEDIKADGSHGVTITMKSGNADLPYTLSDYHLVMMPSDGEGNVDWESGIGTGAYSIEHHEAGVRSSLKRNENYFKEGRANFDSVAMIQLSDPNARQTALKTGEVDAVTSLDLKTVHLLKRDPNLVIQNVPSGAAITMPMFCDVKPFDNNDVRQAMMYAMDRQEILDKIFKGFGTIGNDTHIAPALPYHAADIPAKAYDPDKAKSLLKKAGYDSIDVELSAADGAFAGAVDMATLYSAQAAKAGINVKVVREPNDGYWSNVWLVKPFVMVSWGARPTPDVMYSLAYKDDAPWNESHWKNPRFNELLLLAKAELDDKKRAEMYREMQMLQATDGGSIIPIYRNRVYAHTKNIGHSDKLTANWELDGGRAAERWWFES
ncbi:ABC transporter substrate-binding protein [Hwanghaeella sp.]|uniref:ABC transporter substrate-binding protein n=1 Tax=Hwanghaeella sp. TaxID=2605943 RepID=UPI003CCB8606